MLGNAVGCMLLVDMLVQQTERAHHCASLIGEERIGNPIRVGKPTEHVYSIIADGEDGDVRAHEVGQAPLQLDELRLAEGSPTGAAVEHHQGPPGATHLMEIYGMAMLIRQEDVGEALPNRGADPAKINAEVRDGRHRHSLSMG